MRTFPGCALIVVGLGLAALTLAACDPDLPAQEFPDPAACSDLNRGDLDGFEAEAAPIFATYCSWCHDSARDTAEDRKGAPTGVNYDDYDYAVANTFLTWARMADRSMPPMGKLPTAEEYRTMMDWLSCADAWREANRRGSAGDDDDSAG